MMVETFYYAGDEIAWLQSIESNKYKEVILITDAKSNGFCIPILRNLIPSFCNSNLIVLPDGEQNKTMDVCQLLWQQFHEYEVNKATLIVAVGGGVLLDLVGFASATYMRGIDCAYVPTTLMAMVDASVGGKTAVDFSGVKNLIGVFALPKSLYINPIFLKTLPIRHVRNGTAEMIKHKILAGGAEWKQVEVMVIDDFCSLRNIKQSIEFKSKVVKGDYMDKGVRQILNFGHTLGHAIESTMMYGKKPLLHGESIMMGMDLELRLSKELFAFPQSEFEYWTKLKSKFFPELKLDIGFDQIASFLRSDKKNDHRMRMSLLRSPGVYELKVMVPEHLIKQVVDES